MKPEADSTHPAKPETVEYLELLNSEQCRAVKTLDGPLLVLSGAGTGKTRVLTARIARLLATGKARPQETLVVTFTNRAANEMRERVEKISKRSAAGWWLGTFHSLGSRILRQHAEQVGLKSDFTILDADDQLRVLKKVLEESNLDQGRWPPRKLRSVIERWKNLGLSPGSADDEGMDFAQGKGHALYTKYQDRLKQLNAADFGDLLLHNLSLFRDSQTLSTWQRRFRYILVDEYQDTNTAQYLWLRLLAGGHGNLCVVGDEDQSIYGWRGADVGNILRFEQDFPNTTVVRLEQNYRSTGHILGAASAVISRNRMRIGKTLWTEGGEGLPVLIRETGDSEDEARLVSNDIEKIRDSGSSLEEVAILVRTSALTRGFEERFLQISLPYRIVGGVRFYERQEIRDAISYLRLVHRQGDDLAFERISNRPRRGIGATTLRRITEHARGTRTNLEEATRSLLAAEEIRGKARNGLRSFLDAIERWRTMHRNGTPANEIAKTVLDESGYLEMWQKENSAESAGRIENLNELANAIGEFESLEGFLEHVSLVQDHDDGSASGRVALMTLHGAKGLEFNTVFLPGWEDGLFPHELAMNEGGDAGLEEERRLAYVGLTRARLEARISYACRRMQRGSWGEQFPSRFIAEIPEQHMRSENVPEEGLANSGRDVTRPAIGDRRSRYHRYTERGRNLIDVTPSKPVNEEDASAFEDGMRVFHQKFGYGTIVSVDGKALEIDFETSGVKKIMHEYIELAAG